MDVEKWAANARGGTPDNQRDQHFGPVARAVALAAALRLPRVDRDDAAVRRDGRGRHRAVAGGAEAGDPGVAGGDVPGPDGAAPRRPTRPRAARPRPARAGTTSATRACTARTGCGRRCTPGTSPAVTCTSRRWSTRPTRRLLTDAAFEADRRAVVDQTVALVTGRRGARVARRRGVASWRTRVEAQPAARAVLGQHLRSRPRRGRRAASSAAAGPPRSTRASRIDVVARQVGAVEVVRPGDHVEGEAHLVPHALHEVHDPGAGQRGELAVEVDVRGADADPVPRRAPCASARSRVSTTASSPAAPAVVGRDGRALDEAADVVQLGHVLRRSAPGRTRPG